MGSIRGFEDGLFAMRNATRVRFLDCAFEVNLSNFICYHGTYRDLTFCTKQPIKSIERTDLKKLQAEYKRQIRHLDESRHNDELRQGYKYVSKVKNVES